MSLVCGICGLLAPDGTPDPALVSRMNAALVHRGPDEGSVDGFGRCVLAHRRLQVIDLETGSQPVANEAGDVVAVFNGELYNFRELRVELSRHDVRGTGDTPVIPHLYEEHGLEFADRLSGMFAIALWDAARERLVLARDHVGKKPLVYARLEDGSLAFASEVKALLQLPGVRREVDPAQLDAYLALQYVPGGTGLRGIEKLPPGHLLVAEKGSVRVEPFTEPARLDTRPDEEWLELVRAEVAGAVERRLVADVPLGALLSGGIDSSIVVALMAQASRRPVRTFTVGFGEPRLRRAAVRARGRRAVRDRARGGRARARRPVDAAAPRRGVRRAARRRGRAAALPDLRGGARGGDRRAHGRRRRRVLRRLRALPCTPARRAAARRRRSRRRADAPPPLPRAAFVCDPGGPSPGDGRGAARGALRAADGDLPRRAPRRAVGAGVRARARDPQRSCWARRTAPGSTRCSGWTCAATSPATCS